MASTSLSSKIENLCIVSLKLQDNLYGKVKFSIMKDLCCDVILGQEFLKQNSSVHIPFGGNRPPFKICSLTAASVPLPSLFANLLPNCTPIAIKSRRDSDSDGEFIDSEVKRLLNENIIEPSMSPWRAQVLVTTNVNKKRMVIDYSQTINKFTMLDAYPLPHIEEMVSKIAQFNV